VNRKAVLWLSGVLAAAGSISGAQASTLGASGDSTPVVLAYLTELEQGSQPSVTPLDVPSAGELSVTLTDMQFPSPFASLQFALADANSMLTMLSNAGTTTLDLTAPITLYADVFATSQTGGSGLYNLTAAFVPSSSVPLPPSAASLAGGLLVLLLGLCNIALSRGRGPTQATVTTPVA
jgi:hypothetical protein